MSFFQSLGNFFGSLFGGKKRKEEKEWASLNFGKPAKPDNLIPLDPNDPWKT